jgi:hypothetical protein
MFRLEWNIGVEVLSAAESRVSVRAVDVPQRSSAQRCRGGRICGHAALRDAALDRESVAPVKERPQKAESAV